MLHDPSEINFHTLMVMISLAPTESSHEYIWLFLWHCYIHIFLHCVSFCSSVMSAKTIAIHTASLLLSSQQHTVTWRWHNLTEGVWGHNVACIVMLDHVWRTVQVLNKVPIPSSGIAIDHFYMSCNVCFYILWMI